MQSTSEHHNAQRKLGRGVWVHGIGNAKPIYDNGKTVKNVIKKAQGRKK